MFIVHYSPPIDFFALSLAKIHYVIQDGYQAIFPSDLISVFRYCPPSVNKTNILKPLLKQENRFLFAKTSKEAGLVFRAMPGNRKKTQNMPSVSLKVWLSSHKLILFVLSGFKRRVIK